MQGHNSQCRVYRGRFRSMSRRYWLPFVALLALAGTGARGAESAGRGAANDHAGLISYAHAPPGISPSVDRDLRRIADALEAMEVKKKPSTIEDERAERDIKAQ